MRTWLAACFFIFIILSSHSLRSQEPMNLPALEDSLSILQRQILKAGNDTIKLSLNSKFRNLLRTAIGLPGSFTYPFDSLRKIAKLTSPDKLFRMYNWNIPLVNGSNFYYCYLQMPDKNNNNGYTIFELHDKSDSIPDPEHTALGGNNWYGTLYYKIICEKFNKITLYTLLGWHGNVMEVQKMIEVLWFDQQGLPHFGKKVFNKYKDGENKRVIFKYSPLSSMVLRYEEQSTSRSKKWNKSQHRFDEKYSKSRMIVCDRLVTVDQTEGKGQIIAPAGDIFDGFIFGNGRWNFVEGVDARNR